MRLKDYGRKQKNRKEYIQLDALLLMGSVIYYLLIIGYGIFKNFNWTVMNLNLKSSFCFIVRKDR